MKLLVPLYTRLDRSRLLGHPLRAKLLALVEAEPGIHLEAAQMQLGASAGTVAHHVRLLGKSGLLREARDGRFHRLYPPDADAARIARDAALRPERSAAFYALVQRQPGIGLREAARQLGVPASSLQWHASRLAAAGLVERRWDGLHARDVAPRTTPASRVRARA
jgi:predicted transcriptional regulator